MLALERKKIILDYLASNEVATTQQLSKLTNASLATLRRDLNSLSLQGLLKKTHGGAQSLPGGTPRLSLDASIQSPPEFDPFLAQKDAISQKAATLIQSNDIVFIGAGMTCNLLCRYLNQSSVENLTVVTTNITAAMELAFNSKITTLLLGGRVHPGPNHVETLDENTMQSMEQLYFNNVFITVDGADLNYGYSINNRAQLPLYHYLLQNSRQIYVLMNDGKFGKRAFAYLCGLESISNVITNTSISPEYLSYYETHDIRVCTV